MSKESLLNKLDDLLSGKSNLTIKISFGVEEKGVKQPEKKEVGEKTEEKKKEPVKPKTGSQTVDEFDATLKEEKKKEPVKPDPKKVGTKSPTPKKDIEKVEAATEDEPKKVILQEGQEHCIACGGTGKNSKGGSCVPCKGTGIKQEDKTKEAPVKEEKPDEPEMNSSDENSEDDDWDF